MSALLERVLVLLGLAAALLAGAAYAAVDPAPDPAAMQIERLDNALLQAMKSDPKLGAAARYAKLAPVVERTFDFTAMTRFSVGPAWSRFSAEEQTAAIGAFTRLTIASYAHNFHEFGAERFEIDAQVASRGVDKIVQTHLISPNGKPVGLMYRMRESAGSWKIIDVYYGAISQLTTRRSDFAAPLAAGGAQGLIVHLDSLSAALMK